MKLSEECWTVLRLGRGPTGRWVAVPPVWGGEWNDVAFFDTQPEAFAHAFWKCTDRREMFGIRVPGQFATRGRRADMEALYLELMGEGYAPVFMVGEHLLDDPDPLWR